MKKINLLLTAISVSMLISCDNANVSQEEISSFNNESIIETMEPKEENTLVSTVRKLENGKTYLEVDGKPFTLRGAQVRIDGLLNRTSQNIESHPPLTETEIEKYFENAKKCHLNTLELSLDWARIEPTKDNFDFSLVDMLLRLSNKYDLKCEFLWFSTNMCGDSHEFQVPNYILDDDVTYPKLQSEYVRYSGIYGMYCNLILNNPNLMERERNVLNKLMDYIYNWNLDHDNKNPLIGIQVHNEADCLLRWRYDSHKFKIDGRVATRKDLWDMTLESLDNAGKAIKNSKYQIYTRCNMCVTLGNKVFPQTSQEGYSPMDVYNLEGIDIVGDDPYSENPVAINDDVVSYSFDNNYPMICENMGNYSNSPALFLTAYQAGGCYMFYDLATPEYFVFINGTSSYQMDQGLLNPNFTYKAHSLKTISMIKGIESVESIIPTLDNNNFACFNVLNIEPVEQLVQTINTSNIEITYKTNNGGIAFAIEKDEYLYLYSTDDAIFNLENVSFVYKADIGCFKGDEFEIEDSVILNPDMEIKSSKLYRIKIRTINEQVSSTTNQNV